MTGEKDSILPFFSIGITTYNRKELLKKTLTSIINQDFEEFEIIVGNDYLAESLTYEQIGIRDHRIIIVNNEINLGELENMNSLLKHARGRYFAWIFDDDLCAPGFLNESYEALKKFDFPKCIHSSFFYIYGNSAPVLSLKKPLKSLKYSGQSFLRQYLSGSIRVIGLGGFHDTDYLKGIGGVARLTGGRMALYSEYLLILKDGLLPEVVYIDAELLGNRVHDDSFSYRSTDVDLFKQAGVSLLRESINILSDNSLRIDFGLNISSLIKSVISVVVTKSRISGKRISSTEISEYIQKLKDEFQAIDNPDLYVLAIRSLENSRKQIFIFRIKAFLKVILPLKYLKFAHLVHSWISKYTNKSF